MFGDKYGPFAQTVVIAAALVAVFSGLVLKAIGKVSQWTFLAHDSPPFVVAAGTRALAVALIAATFILIGKNNYGWFAGAAVVLSLLMIVLIGQFDRARKQYICKVPLLNSDGTQAKTFWGKGKFEAVIIGDEEDMTSKAVKAYRQLNVSPCKFLSGFGENGVNDPAAIWPPAVLARNSNRMTMLLMGILLSGVMALYLAASAVEVHLRPVAGTAAIAQ